MRLNLAQRGGYCPGATTAGRAETADTAVNAEDSQGLGGLPASAFFDHCDVGSRTYAGVCIEATPRTGATWTVAAKICGDAGGRLPSLGELEGFRQQPGITLSGGEYTSTYIDVNGLDADGEFTVGLFDNGARSPGFAYGSSNGAYRCVRPMSNL